MDPASGAQVQVTVTFVAIKDNNNCSRSSLALYDGPSADDALLMGQICSTESPPTFTSRGSVMLVRLRLHTDMAAIRRSFSLTYVSSSSGGYVGTTVNVSTNFAAERSSVWRRLFFGVGEIQQPELSGTLSAAGELRVANVQQPRQPD